MRETDAETTPLRNPEHYQYDFNLADIAEVWRRGSVVASWLLDLTAISLFRAADAREIFRPRFRFRRRPLDHHRRHRTTAPAPVLSAALYQRFTSRGEDDFADKMLSAMRFQFGGHVEKKVRTLRLSQNSASRRTHSEDRTAVS